MPDPITLGGAPPETVLPPPAPEAEEALRGTVNDALLSLLDRLQEPVTRMATRLRLFRRPPRDGVGEVRSRGDLRQGRKAEFAHSVSPTHRYFAVSA